MFSFVVEDSFDIKDILECGQAFRYDVIEAGHYEVIALGRRLRVSQVGEEVTFDCSDDDYLVHWYNYFDMDVNYSAMKQRLIEIDSRMSAYISKKPGIRILRQAPFEMLMTFILSQNKSMPQIKQLVARISENYGTELEDGYGRFHCFPEPEQLAQVTEAEFRALKVGFRAPYLVDAVDKVISGAVDLHRINECTTEEARIRLLTIKGVGRKVADCVLLFGYHRMDVFPLDVWMKRAVSHLYYQEQKVTDKEMLTFAEETFGELSGIAQQYLFYGTVEGIR